MREFSTAIQGEIDKQFGGEPMVMVEVAWNGVNYVAYTDRKLNDSNYPFPLVHSIGTFDTTTVVSGSSDSQSVSVIFNDIDGSIRDLINKNDIHLRPVRIYLTYQGLPVSEKALMFEGVINSPIQWDEGGRTLTISVFSKLEGTEAGFTMEDGDFPFVPPSEANKPWPLVFGQVCNMEAVQVTALRKGFLAQGVGVPDPTLEDRLCQALKLKCPKIVSTGTNQLTLDDIEIVTVISNTWGAQGQNSHAMGPNGVLTSEEYTQVLNTRAGKVDPQCVSRRFIEICKIRQEIENQNQYVVNPFTVRGGEEFPQGEKITIQIDEVKFDGVMTGESFLASQSYHPQLETIDNPVCKSIKNGAIGWRSKPTPGLLPKDIAECSTLTSATPDVVNGSGESWEYYEQFESGDFIWLPPGSEVVLADESDLIYIVSLLPGVVDQVAAYRTYGDTTLLTEIDTDRYTVHTTNYGDYDVVEIWLESPMSTIDDQKWDDDLYVSFTSSVGPNPADTIEWLVNKYTDYTIDTASFAHVESMLTNYPSNFWVKSRPQVLELIRDIAYQSRCAIYIRQGIMYLVYLSEEPTSVVTLTEDDILTESFKINHTTTEDLETRTLIKWHEADAGVNKDDETDFEFILKHNVPKYGIFDAEYEYNTMNMYDLIEKSATFWMIRNANTWRLVEFETPVTHLNLDVFDCMTLNIAQFPTTKIVITEASYQIDSNTIAFKAWTPILSGTEEEYKWAWPSQQLENDMFPEAGAVGESGDGNGLNVVPPVGHPLRGGYDPDIAREQTNGDPFPSDIGDTFPTVVCKVATGAEIADAVEPNVDIVEPLAKKNFKDKLENIESTGLSVSIKDPDDDSPPDDNPDDDKEDQQDDDSAGGGLPCVYTVNTVYVTPRTVTSNCNGGPCKEAGNPDTGTGQVCTNTWLGTVDFQFLTYEAAQTALIRIQQEVDKLKSGCGGYKKGVTAPYLKPLSVGGPTPQNGFPCTDYEPPPTSDEENPYATGESDDPRDPNEPITNPEVS